LTKAASRQQAEEDTVEARPASVHYHHYAPAPTQTAPELIGLHHRHHPVLPAIPQQTGAPAADHAQLYTLPPIQV